MQKIDVITVQGMMKLFEVSRQTLYNKYIPFLDKLPSTDNKLYFDYKKAVELHKKYSAQNQQYNVIA